MWRRTSCLVAKRGCGAKFIQTIILAGMSANLCMESHLRDAIENTFDVIAVKDATTGPGPDATKAA